MNRSLVRWNPRNQLLRNQVSRLFDESFNDFLAPVRDTADVLETDWLPPVDIREDDGHLVLFVEVPGMNREQIEITLENRVLTLRGERKFERDEDRDRYHRVERAYGSFSRSFHLPANVDTGAAKATFTDGILQIELPKTEEAKPKTLEIG